MKYKNIELCRDGHYLKQELSDKQLQIIEDILDAYGSKIDLIIPRDEDDEIVFDGEWEVEIIDEAYQEVGYELIVLKWYEDFEDTGYMVEVIKGDI